MTWNYRVLRYWGARFDNEAMYTVIEAYYDEDGNLTGGTSDSKDTLVWDNLVDLKRTAEQVLKAFDLPVVEYIVDGGTKKLVETDELVNPDDDGLGGLR